MKVLIEEKSRYSIKSSIYEMFHVDVFLGQIMYLTHLAILKRSCFDAESKSPIKYISNLRLVISIIDHHDLPSLNALNLPQFLVFHCQLIPIQSVSLKINYVLDISQLKCR